MAIVIYVQLGAMLANWGNKDYVLASIVAKPQLRQTVWNQSFATRSVLLMIGLLAIHLSLPASMSLPTSLWLLALFITQSYDVLVLLQHAFKRFAIMEAGFFIGYLLAAWWALPYIDQPFELLYFMAAFQLLRSLLYSLRFRRWIIPRHWRFTGTFFLSALPFFAIGLTGMLVSKLDLYLAEQWLHKAKFGQYQLYSTLFLQAQAIAGIFLMPFATLLLKAKAKTVKRFTLRFSLIGALLSATTGLFIWLVCQYFYGFDFPHWYYGCSALTTATVFFLSPVMYFLYQKGKAMLVVQVNLLGIVLIWLLAQLLVSRLGMGGLILSILLVQVFMAFVYKRLASAKEKGNTET